MLSMKRGRDVKGSELQHRLNVRQSANRGADGREGICAR